ncbi:hypothetical protein [Halorubrum ezzemoulense]|jgi:hypothetical protein|uniref:hypothetical protein n=1 Tax=Halorubrum ezzemoulense TaxID=337243 RepID=UPI00232BEB85|nr:hypothetical protein [Halorubrum ezzemoulense]MDB9252995.1 hypothetical protein [Halorubrum ezzemoulense]MDB9256620.1 hypothetical protein [Halorubrum ezzemoulense]MDB9278027.1 hypothetical protein [Halorubrum ezzemoulense]
MGSDSRRTHECPEPCRDVLNIVSAEETTLVDAVSSGDLDRRDIETFLRYAVDHDVDPGTVHLVKIVDALIEERNIRESVETDATSTG